jgi:hypothetical protein
MSGDVVWILQYPYQCGALTGLAKTTLVVKLCGYLHIHIVALALTGPLKILTIPPKHHELWSKSWLEEVENFCGSF